MFIDVHCHLDSRFYDAEEVEKVIERARKKNVKIIIASGIGINENREVIELAKKYKEIKGALGVHPTEILRNIDEEIGFIRAHADKIIAIGEVGLDFLESKVDCDKQKKVFQKFIELAVELDLPLIVHSRKTEKECIEMLEDFKAKKIVMHCFSGGFKLIDRIAANGWNFSVPASVKYNEHFQNLVKRVDISQLLCETDAPFLHPSRDGKNEPSFVVESYKKIAEIKELSLKKVEIEIEENFRRLFIRENSLKEVEIEIEKNFKKLFDGKKIS